MSTATWRNGRARCRCSTANPTIRALDTEDAECNTICRWLTGRLSEGLRPGEISVFVRSHDQLARVMEVAKRSNIPYAVLDDEMEADEDRLSVGTMHLAKGLEFRAVVVMACDSEIIPLQSRVETVTDEADLEEVYNSERNLLYVACTRARDHLLVTGVEPASEFLDDLRYYG